MVKRVIVAGSRCYNNFAEAESYIDFYISELRKEYHIIFISGGGKGADMLGEKYAAKNGFEIERYPAEWDKYGRSAGPRRNQKMAEAGDCLICFWDGKSRGTKSMIEIAGRKGMPIKIKLI